MIKAISIILLAITFIGCVNKNENQSPDTKNATDTEYQKAIPEIREFLFVGMIRSRAGIYKYDFSSKSYSNFWQSDQEDVLELAYSPDKKALFVLTASGSGKTGVFPFIKNVKLYVHSLDAKSIKFVDNLGGGLQFFATWLEDSSFQITMHSLDSKAEQYVEQKTTMYDRGGKKITGSSKKFFFAKQGFPSFPAQQKKLKSYDNKYSLLSIDSVQNQILLIDHTKQNQQVLITKQTQKLNSVAWSKDGKYLVLNTIDISPNNETLYDSEPNTSKLFIYSLTDQKVLKTFEGGGIKNFFLTEQYAVFDDGFNSKTKILIFDLFTKTVSDSIFISGGCGLKKIPMIPDYEA